MSDLLTKVLTTNPQGILYINYVYIQYIAVHIRLELHKLES